MTSVSGRKDK